MRPILIVRPDPGAAGTAARAKRLGLDPVIAPIFTIRSVAWSAPAAEEVETVLLTSASAARCGGEGLKDFMHLPCHAVGPATGECARTAGFTDIRIGPGDGVALLEMMAKAGVERALHLCGRDHIPLAHPDISIARRIVYASDAVENMPAAAHRAIGRGALALLHSPRAAAHFALLADKAGLDRSAIAVAAISDAAAAAAGEGWRNKAAARAPRDEALLELAAKLCKTAPVGEAG